MCTHLNDGPAAPRRRWLGVGKTLVMGALALVAWGGGLPAATINLPNGSFELPPTASVDTRIDAWQKTPKPDWWDESTFGAWDQLIGAFANLPAGDPRYIDNCDGSQAIWLFANPAVGLFQDFNSTDWSNAVPSHAFDARFAVGRSYQLTVGILVGTAYPMAEGATLELNLYYRDAASNRVTVAATSVTNRSSVFSNATHLIDFQVRVPTVKASDAWAGQHIGVAFMSTVDSAHAGGYWDLDHVRLTEAQVPALVGPTTSNGAIGFRLQSEPGQKLEVLTSADIGLPMTNWVSLGVLSNASGDVFVVAPATNTLRSFYQVRQVP
jgi:hypothetical protein